MLHGGTMYRRIITTMFVVLLFSFAFVLPVNAQPAQGELAEGAVTAQELGLYYGEATGLGQSSLQETIARIIRVALSLLGIVALVIMLIGGFTWMTAGGDEEKVAKAKQWLLNGTIGLAIILSAYAITAFVINSLVDGTTGNFGDAGNQVGGGGGFGAGGCGNPPCSGNNFVAKISPKGQQRIQNVVVKLNFQDRGRAASVNENTLDLGNNIKVYRTDDDDKNQVAVELEVVSGSEVLVHPRGACPEPNQDRTECFVADVSYTVELKTGIQTAGEGRSLHCPLSDASAFACKRVFTAGNEFDSTPPNIQITNLRNGSSVPYGDEIDIDIRATDDFGVDLVQYTIGGQNMFTSDFEGNPLVVVDTYAWDIDIDSYQPLQQVPIQITARDVDGNVTQTDEIRVVLRPQHCFNRVTDEDEEGRDCGGDWCAACAGASCRDDGDCADGFCRIDDGDEIGLCVALPIITGVSPENGAPGTIVTITGRNFTDQAGEVVFYADPEDPDTAIVAAGGACGVNWSDQSVTVAVPADLAEGAIYPIGIRALGEEDTTDDDYGARFDNVFTITGQQRPGICQIDPEEGLVNDVVEIRGVNLGDGNDSALLFDSQATRVSSWEEDNGGQLGTVAGFIPNMPAGRAGVQVQVGEEKSNPLFFQIQAVREEDRPTLAGIAPAEGPAGTYVTLTGSGFGNSDEGNQVFFVDPLVGDIPASVDFPEICGDPVWNRDTAIVKVPEAARADVNYKVLVRLANGDIDSNDINFRVVGGEPLPGICKADPDMRGAGGVINLHGEYFGDDGAVHFWDADASDDDAATWSAADQVVAYDADQIQQITVPAAAISGPVRVQRADGALSNTVPFVVGSCIENNNQCSQEGNECCQSGYYEGVCRASCEASAKTSEYSWIFSTGEIPLRPAVLECCGNEDACPLPSPSPWRSHPGSTSVCTNAFIRGNFTSRIDFGRGSPGDSILLERCIGEDPENPCTDFELVETGGASIVNNGANSSRFEFSGAHTPALEANFVYQVRVVEGIWAESLEGGAVEQMQEDEDAVERCGGEDHAAGTAYCFRFVTGDFECSIGGVAVVPSEFTAKELGWLVADDGNSVVTELDDASTPLYHAGVLTSNQCVTLDPDEYPWQWRSSDQEYATLQELGGAGEGADRFVEALKRTVDSQPVQISASTGNFTDTGDLIISPGDPQIIAAWPQCQEACVNSQLGLSFNMRMDAARVNAASIQMFRCVDELCNFQDTARAGLWRPLIASVAYVDNEDPDLPEYQKHKARFILVEDLLPNKFYRVFMNGSSVTNSFGIPLSQISDQYDYDLHGNGNSSYKSFTFKTRISGEPCQIESVSVDPIDATVYAIGAQQWFEATASGEENGCGPVGRAQVLTAQNMSWAWESSDDVLVDITTFDVSANPAPGCTSDCRLQGSEERIAACGDGQIGIGEECDPPNADWCSDSCLLVGAPPVCLDVDEFGNPLDLGDCPAEQIIGGGTCGDDNVDQGEQCDDGGYCLLDTAISCVIGDGKCSEQALCVLEEGKNTGFCADGSECRADRECTDICVPRSGDGCSTLCKYEGSSSVGVTCGNNDRAYGEACDDGNKLGGDGCSAECLNEGQPVSYAWCEQQGDGATDVYPSCRFAVAVCGNGVLEPGEACDSGDEDDIYCSENCLRTGAQMVGCEALDDNGVALEYAKCPDESRTGSCGNDRVEEDLGEECDGENGCERCLWNGSSTQYAQPSMCGDGRAGSGESRLWCELDQHGDGKTDPVILAKITENVDDLVGDNYASLELGDDGVGDDARVSATITATATQGEAEGIGEATLTLQCGFDPIEDTCPDPENFGVAANGCCYAYPVLHDQQPVGEGACRNPVLSVVSDSGIDATSVEGNVLLVSKKRGSCAEGEQRVAMGGTTVRMSTTWWSRFTGVVRKVFSFVAPQTAHAEVDISSSLSRMWSTLRIGTNIDSVTRDSTEMLNRTRGDLRAQISADDRAWRGIKRRMRTQWDILSEWRPFSDELSDEQQNILREMDVAVAAALDDVNTLLDSLNVIEASIIEAEIEGLDDEIVDIREEAVEDIIPDLEETREKIAGILDNIPVWCSSQLRATYEAVANEDGSSTLRMLPQILMDADTQYRVVLRSGEDGIKDGRGIAINSDFEWTFSTGTDICTLDDVQISASAWVFPTSQEATGAVCNPRAPQDACGVGGLCVEAGDVHRCDLSRHSFVAAAYTGVGDQVRPIAPTPNIYDWEFQWGPQESTIIEIANDGTSEKVVGALAGDSGEVTLFANAVITTDTINTPSQAEQEEGDVARVVTGEAKILSAACERPWPPLDGDGPRYPYQDVAGNNDGISDNAAAAVDSTNIFTNFGTWYCMDYGEPGADDDLPALIPSVSYNSDDDPQMIKRVHFTNPENNDLIGLMVRGNPRWLDLQQWYDDQFPGQGSLTSIGSINGFEAAQLGNTIYVNAVNYQAPPEGDESLFANVYIFSVSGVGNRDATVETKDIFAQIINNLKFTENVQQYNRCAARNGQSPDPASDICTADVDCGDGGRCLSDGDKLRRDLTRVDDARTILRGLVGFRSENDSFPTLTEVDNSVGSFIAGFTTSKWSSWQAALGNTVGTAFPEDPVNVMRGCLEDEGYDLATCWNVQNQQFFCDAESHTYQYRTNGSAQKAQISMSFEFFDPIEQEALASRIADEQRNGVEFIHSACVSGEGGVVSAGLGICGNGIVESGEECETGQIQEVACGGGMDDGVISVAVLDSQTHRITPTKQIQVCNAQCEFELQTDYTANRCTNRIGAISFQCDGDDDCSGANTCVEKQVTCVLERELPSPPEPGCGNGILEEGEKCEVGGLLLVPSTIMAVASPVAGLPPNGSEEKIPQYAGFECNNRCDGSRMILFVPKKRCEGREHQNLMCVDDANCPTSCIDDAGFVATKDDFAELKGASIDELTSLFACGNGVIDQGLNEVCDDGALNGRYGGYCNPFCTGYTQFCGDGIVTEEHELCDLSVVEDFDSVWSPYARLEENTCSLSCTGRGSWCGDGNVDEIEECDDGNVQSGDGCNELCEEEPRSPSECGNGIKEPWGGEECDGGERCNNDCTILGAYCGNGLLDDGEICDQGDLNGVMCNAEYEKQCSYCSANCRNVLYAAGPYCGDGTMDRSDGEFCDGVDGPNGYICFNEDYQAVDEVLRCTPQCGNYVCSEQEGSTESDNGLELCKVGEDCVEVDINLSDPGHPDDAFAMRIRKLDHAGNPDGEWADAGETEIGQRSSVSYEYLPVGRYQVRVEYVGSNRANFCNSYNFCGNCECGPGGNNRECTGNRKYCNANERNRADVGTLRLDMSENIVINGAVQSSRAISDVWESDRDYRDFFLGLEGGYGWFADWLRERDAGVNRDFEDYVDTRWVQEIDNNLWADTKLKLIREASMYDRFEPTCKRRCGTNDQEWQMDIERTRALAAEDLIGTPFPQDKINDIVGGPYIELEILVVPD